MKELQLLGTLLHSHPNFLPIIQSIREKYQFPDFSPGDDPINEISIEDEIIPIEEFRKVIFLGQAGFQPNHYQQHKSRSKWITPCIH